MSTQRQKRIAKLIVENAGLDKPLNNGQIVENSGYGKTMRKYPKRVIETEGVKNELQTLGFSEEGAKSVVQEILYNPKVDPNARLKASDQVFKVQGSYAPEKKDITTKGDKLPNTDLDKLAEVMAETLKQQKT